MLGWQVFAWTLLVLVGVLGFAASAVPAAAAAPAAPFVPVPAAAAKDPKVSPAGTPPVKAEVPLAGSSPGASHFVLRNPMKKMP